MLYLFVLILLFGGTYAKDVCFTSSGRTSAMGTKFEESNMRLDSWSGTTCLGVPGAMLTQCDMPFTYNFIKDIAGPMPLICTHGSAACWQFVGLGGFWMEINYYYSGMSWNLKTRRGRVTNIHAKYMSPTNFQPYMYYMTMDTDDCWDVYSDRTKPDQPKPPPVDPPSRSCYDGAYGKGEHNGNWGHCCKDSDDCRWSCRFGVCGIATDPKLECAPGYDDEGEHDGPAGACCSDSDDCISSCDDGVCTKPSTSNCKRELGEGDGYGGDCCGHERDCREQCKGGYCSGPTAPKPPPVINPGTNSCIIGWCGKGDGNGQTGACCSTEADCDDTCNGDGKCGTDDGTWRGPLNCNRGSKTTSTRSPSPTPTKYCKSGYYSKGLHNAPQGYCCKSPMDCQGNCVGGMCDKPDPKTSLVPTPTPTGKVCKSGYYGKGLKNGPDTYCCKNTNDCAGLCISGVCAGGVTSTQTAQPTPTVSCILGLEGISDGESEQGYCCLTSADCMGECVNGICGPSTTYPRESSPNRCVFGGFGYSNGNLPLGYCCFKDGDCMYNKCSGGICGDGSGSPCSPSKTTTTTTATKTTGNQKPTPTSVDFTEIKFPVVCGGCPFPIVVFGDFVLTFGGFFGGLLGSHDDDDNDKDDDNDDNVDTKDPNKNPSLKPPPIVFTKYTFLPPVNGTTTTHSSTSFSRVVADTTSNSMTFMTRSSNAVAANTTSIIPVITGATTPSFVPSTNPVITPVATNTSSVSISSMSSTSVTDTHTFSSGTSITGTNVLSSTSITGVRTFSSSTSTTLSTGTSTSSIATKSTSITGLPTATVIGKTCKKGYYGKALKSGPDGYCCSATIDCIGTCVYVPGDSYMCKDGITSTGVPTGTSASTSPIGKPTGTSCIQGYCGKGTGKGPTGACCSDQWDCDDTCNANGKCGLSDETWTKKLPC